MRRLITALTLGTALTMVAFSSIPSSSVLAGNEIVEKTAEKEPHKSFKINPIPLKDVAIGLGRKDYKFSIGVGADYQQVDPVEFKTKDSTITFQEWLDDNGKKLSAGFYLDSDCGKVSDSSVFQVLSLYCSTVDWFKGEDVDLTDSSGNRCCVRYGDAENSVSISFFCNATSLGEDKTTSKYYLSV